ncbi:MAG: hypothetical protein LQ346_003428 [Caloplaca aetnensis]|nr:MAG: hypothetical protein LQ346_003428 [Caloplaca aetnensis]
MANVVAAAGSQDDDEARQLARFNDALTILIELFPNVLPEVFREMLVRFNAEEQIVEEVTKHLLGRPDIWLKGRLKPPVERADIPASAKSSEPPQTDLFRRNNYKSAARAALLQEFKSLSKSTVKAVLAEKNHSYTLARPVLQDIAAKSWRHSINKFFSRWSKSSDDVSEKHGMVQWSRSADGTHVPVLRQSADAELDHELHQTIVQPWYARSKVQQEANDWQLAERLNEIEAISAEAVFECGCCFASTTFEQMASCSFDSLHIICFQCISRAVGEALFGQSWGKVIDHDRGLLRCLAPTADESCSGSFSHEITQRAVCHAKRGAQTWSKFQSRLREEAFAKAQIPLVSCPVCGYAESTDLYLPPGSFEYVMATLLRNSLTHLRNSTLLPTRFRCLNPTCAALACMTCSQPWLDPHTCFEASAATSPDEDNPTSLRRHIEAARTLALKRTCPRCNTSFIKDSGCNKLTCVCGYSMCYMCRQGLGGGLDGGEGEGYLHFCQHFRVDGGRCGECEKCDLYGGEEEEGDKVEVAGKKAEREWREKWGMIKGGAAGGMRRESALEKDGADAEGWTVQGLVDWWVASVLVCKEKPPRMAARRESLGELVGVWQYLP